MFFICFVSAKNGGLSVRTLLNSPDNYSNVCLHLAIKNGHKEVSGPTAEYCFNVLNYFSSFENKKQGDYIISLLIKSTIYINCHNKASGYTLRSFWELYPRWDWILLRKRWERQLRFNEVKSPKVLRVSWISVWLKKNPSKMKAEMKLLLFTKFFCIIRSWSCV